MKGKSITGMTFVVGKPKRTTQGSGKHSRPKKGKKPYRGQGH